MQAITSDTTAVPLVGYDTLNVGHWPDTITNLISYIQYEKLKVLCYQYTPPRRQTFQPLVSSVINSVKRFTLTNSLSQIRITVDELNNVGCLSEVDWNRQITCFARAGYGKHR